MDIKKLHLQLANLDQLPRLNKHKKTPRKEKEDKKEEYGIVLYAQHQGNQWYVDSGFSKHIIGDRTKFLSLNENKSGSVNFCNDASGDIMGKGLVIFRNGRGRSQKILFLDRIKHNILSVRKMCNEGYDVTFPSKGCDIK